MSYEVLVMLVVLALAFDFMNGFHDAANSIATIVSTRVLRPQYAVAWAAFFNFVAFAVFGVHVAKTIAKGTVDPAMVTPAIVLAALVGAVAFAYLALIASLVAGLMRQWRDHGAPKPKPKRKDAAPESGMPVRTAPKRIER